MPIAIVAGTAIAYPIRSVRKLFSTGYGRQTAKRHRRGMDGAMLRNAGPTQLAPGRRAVPKWFHGSDAENLPDPIYRVLKREAKRNHRSLNSQIIHTLENEAAEAQRLRQLTNLRKALDRFAASIPPLDDSAPLIRRDRER